MRKSLVVLLILALGLIVVVIGCGQKEGETTYGEPGGVREAEYRDTTARDSAVLEQMPADTIVTQHDSM